MQFLENEVRTLTASIWETILQMPIEETGSSAATEVERPVSACVQITGAWQGAVSLSCPTAFAKRAAGVMFDRTPAEVTKADLQDAVGELANMIGGNIKALLPEPCQLSLPSVVEGDGYTVRVPRSRQVARVAMSCDGEPLHVTILEKEPIAA